VSLAVGPGNEVVVALPEGIYRSGDDPARWERLGSNDFGAEALEIAIDRNGRIAAAANGAAYVSPDRGRTFREARLTFRAPDVTAVGALPGGILLAGSSTHGVYLSLDDGATWRPSVGLAAPATSFTVDRTPSIFAGTSGGGVFGASELGASWSIVSADAPRNVRALVALSTGPLVAASDRGVYVSTEQGGSWALHAQGLPVQDVIDLAVARDGSAVYAATPAGVSRSTDGASTWQPTSLPAVAMKRIAVEPDGSVLALAKEGLFRSTDQGTTWEQVALAAGPWLALAVDSRGAVYLAGDGTGVFRSLDHGASWTKENAGLGDLAVLSLAVGSGDRVFAGTRTGGVFVGR